MMLTPFALKGFALAVSVLFVVSTTVAFAEDTGIVVRENGINRGSIYWWDDDSLLVAGVHSEHPPKDNSGWRLLRFKVSDKSVTDMGQVGALCASNGHLRVSRLSADSVGKAAAHWKFVLYSGSIDQLVEDPPRPIPPPSANPPSFNALSNCKFPDELPPAPAWLESAKKSGRVFRALKPEHGWLEMAIHPRYGIRANPTFPITVHPPGLPDSKGYPVSDVFQKHLGDGFSLWSPEYVPFKDAYFILLDYYQSSRPPGSPLGWWLHPDGRVEEVTFSNPANQTWGNLVFTRAGNLLIRMSFTKSNFHEAGIYLDDVKGPLKLVSGRVQGKAFVSPDGCKVAFGNDTRPDIVPGTERHKLQVIDVCQRILTKGVSVDSRFVPGR